MARFLYDQRDSTPVALAKKFADALERFSPHVKNERASLAMNTAAAGVRYLAKDAPTEEMLGRTLRALRDAHSVAFRRAGAVDDRQLTQVRSVAQGQVEALGNSILFARAGQHSIGEAGGPNALMLMDAADREIEVYERRIRQLQLAMNDSLITTEEFNNLVGATAVGANISAVAIGQETAATERRGQAIVGNTSATAQYTNAKTQQANAAQSTAAAETAATEATISANDDLAETIAYINSLTEERADADRRAVTAASDAAQAMKAVWDSAGKELSGVWDNNWKSLLKGNLDAFDGFAKSILGIGKNAANGILNEIGGALAQQTSSVLSALLGGTRGNTGGLFGLLSGGGFTPSGGWAGLFQNSTLSASVIPNFAQSQWGTLLGLSKYGSLSAGEAATFMANTGMQLPSPALTATGKAFNNLTSGWGIAGGLAGSALSNLFFDHRQGPGSQIGGTIGGIAGSFIPVPFLGTALGSFLGSTVGGLFGPRPSDQTEGAVIDLFNAANDREGFLSNKRSPQNKEMADTIEAALRQFREVMIEAGLNPLARGGLIEVGSGNSLAPFRVSLDASGVQSFKTQQEAFGFLARGLVASLETIPEELQAAIDGFDPSNLQAFIAALMEVADSEELPTIPQGEEPLGNPNDSIGHELSAAQTETLGKITQDATNVAEHSAKAICEIEETAGTRRAAIAQKYADETALIHEKAAATEKARLEERAAFEEEMLIRIGERAREILAQQLNSLEEERRSIEALREKKEAEATLPGAGGDVVVPLPSLEGFARGGRTGHLALVHSGEMIYTGPPAMVYNARETASMMTGGNVLRELQGIRADIGVLSRTVSITGEDQLVQLSRHDMRLAAIESNFSLARARS